MADRLRVGMVGAGAAARELHAPGCQGTERCELVAVASRSRSRAQRLADSFAIPEVFTSAWEMIACERIDAVVVCTPPHTHLELVRRAVEAGKHVLLEKPVAHSLDHVAQIRGLVESARPLIEMVRNERFMELHRELRDVVRSGTLGDPVGIAFLTSTTGPDDWTGGSSWPKERSQGGGGVLLDLGVHKADLAVWLTGSELVGAAPAILRDPVARQGDVEWVAGCGLEGANGLPISISASWMGPPDAMLCTVAGTRGLATANGATGVLTIDGPDGSERRELVAPWSDADSSKVATIDDFVEKCLGGWRPTAFELATWDSGTRWILESYRRRDRERA